MSVFYADEGAAEVAVLDELEWWLDLMAEADRVARTMPTPLRRAIEASGGRHEIVRLAMHAATLSEGSRRSIEATLARAVMLIKGATTGDATPARPAPAVVPLTVVPGPN